MYLDPEKLNHTKKMVFLHIVLICFNLCLSMLMGLLRVKLYCSVKKNMGQHRNELVNQTYPYPNIPTKTNAIIGNCNTLQPSYQSFMNSRDHSV